jgi:hypothetical protein
MAITHWRRGKVPMLIVRMLKTQSLRQRHRAAVIEEVDE